ncbi:MAG: hypothetical protein ABWZ99_08130 [Ilumatobacteraceae bacterium]
MTTTTESTAVRSWILGRLPAAWTERAPTITIDREEITIDLDIDLPSMPDEQSSDLEVGEASAGRIARFREDTRERRMGIAREAEHRFERTVSWAVRCGDRSEAFTNLSAPVMTRLRQQERIVLDTLIEANIARSRSDALAWCVRLVGRNADEWLGSLREAMEAVQEVRATGPDVA